MEVIRVLHTVHLCPEWPPILDWAQGTCRFLLICRVWATVMDTVSLGIAGSFLWWGSRYPSWRACEPWFWERSLRTQTWGRVNGEVITGPMRMSVGQLVWNCKSGDSKVVAQSLVSGLCVQDGL